jgi:tRNA threonylcarbamoyladenosine biosynthesis protein TsaB
MRLLALDTATEGCSVALVLDDQVLVRDAAPGTKAAEVILAMIDAVLTEGGATLASLEAIAFGRGPGAFTGVRLAASVTQGLAFGAGLPVVPVSDLAALAQRALDEEPRATRVLAVGDARMNEVYWGCFERDAAGLASGVGEEHVGGAEKVVLPGAWLAHGGAVLGAGRGLAVHPALAERLALHPLKQTWLPHAREIARLAAARVAAGVFSAPEEALPLYLRDNVAHAKSP